MAMSARSLTTHLLSRLLSLSNPAEWVGEKWGLVCGRRRHIGSCELAVTFSPQLLASLGNPRVGMRDFWWVR